MTTPAEASAPSLVSVRGLSKRYGFTDVATAATLGCVASRSSISRGLAFSPEDSGIFPDLTVAENIEISTWTRPGGRPTAERIERAYEVFPVLRKYRARKGPEMSGGERKMLSVARALALDPAMLLLDEPFEGLSPAIVPSVSRGLAEITQRGHAILLAESNIYHVPDFATRLYVIERGEIIFAGPPAAVRADAATMRVIGGTA